MIIFGLQLLLASLLFLIVYNVILLPLYDMIKIQIKYGTQAQLLFLPITGIFGLWNQGFREEKFAFKQLQDLNKQADGDKMRFLLSNLGSKPIINLIEPQLIKEFLQTQENYVKTDVLPSLAILGKFGLVNSNGGSWRRQRALIGNSFHYEALNARIPLMKEITEKIIQQINTSEAQRVVHISQKITSEVMIQSFFTGELDGKVIEGVPVLDFFMNTINQGVLITSDKYYGLKFLLGGLNFALYRFQGKKEKEFVQNAQLFRKTVIEIIEQRIQIRQANPEKEVIDFIDLYIDAYLKANEHPENDQKNIKESTITQDEIVDQFSTFFIAGTDTTGNLAGICLYFFANFQEVQQKAREQLKKYFQTPSQIQHQDLVKLQYLMAVMNETLRVYGPANHLFPRQALQDLMIQDIKVRQGDFVTIVSYMNMCNDKFYENNEEFNPERWLDENKAPTQPFVYLPFSAGPRNCVGQHMAIIETQIILSYLLMTYEIVPNPAVELKMIMQLVYTPENDALVYFKKL